MQDHYKRIRSKLYIFYCVRVFFLQTRKSKLDNEMLPGHTLQNELKYLQVIFRKLMSLFNMKYGSVVLRVIKTTVCCDRTVIWYFWHWQICPFHVQIVILDGTKFQCDRSVLFFESMTKVSFYAKILDRSVLFPLRNVTKFKFLHKS